MNFLASLSPLDIAMLIALPSAFVLGGLIFFFAGLHHVPKNHAIIIEKAKQYYGTYTKGFVFKLPIAYQKVGTYCIVPITRGYIANNQNHLRITYQVEDVVKFHYSYIGFDEIMRRIEKENSEVTLTVLQDSFSRYGLKFISIDKF